jgi:hypothetical protein
VALIASAAAEAVGVRACGIRVSSAGARVRTLLLALRRFRSMSDDEQYLDDFEIYKQNLNRTPPGRKGVKRKHDARPERVLEDAGLAEPSGVAASWTLTYVRARFEAVWLRASLASLYEEEWISHAAKMARKLLGVH